MKAKTSEKNCKDCGFKIRGKNHENGSHHKLQGEHVAKRRAKMKPKG